MSVALFSNVLANLPAARVRELDQRLRAMGLGGIEAVFVSVWPDTLEERENRQANRAAFGQWRSAVGVPTWAWLVTSHDQAGDVSRAEDLDFELQPDGWNLDIEKWLEAQKLEVLAQGISALGRPVIASLGGFQTSSHANLDFRALEKYGFACDWQAYFDSGEGTFPARAVQELFQSTFVIPGWEYRHRLGPAYGWGKVTRVEAAQVARFDSYRRPGTLDGEFNVSPRDWGYWVVDRELRRNGSVGMLMGRAAYQKIRVTLDVTRTAQERPPEQWTPIAASARVPGAKKRPISIYLAENTSDEVIVAIARGAA